eukprot:TRINITY_DN14170_c0_g1_i1.p1 TRINITY_DN14170_c0_g1~~TRINITY_DN14170_c0_g1_i1.p1  ORF type:complete len:160 (+),score=13.82 TRINITY_DN14170_c0_g1_i1:116-595(+)
MDSSVTDFGKTSIRVPITSESTESLTFISDETTKFSDATFPIVRFGNKLTAYEFFEFMERIQKEIDALNTKSRYMTILWGLMGTLILFVGLFIGNTIDEDSNWIGLAFALPALALWLFLLIRSNEKQNSTSLERIRQFVHNENKERSTVRGITLSLIHI